MSGEETFIARWARLKREAAEKAGEGDAAVPPVPVGKHAAEAVPRDAGESEREPAPVLPDNETEPFDIASLPSIDSITAGSDIRAFLRGDVPAHLARAALRRAWTADPAIRDFIGLAENQWDFTDPASVPGFGALEASDDVGRLVAQALGNLDDEAHVQHGAVAPSPVVEVAGDAPSSAPEVPPTPSPSPQGGGESGRASGGEPVEQGGGGLVEQAAGEPVEHSASESLPRDQTDAATQNQQRTATQLSRPQRRSHGSALPT